MKKMIKRPLIIVFVLIATLAISTIGVFAEWMWESKDKVDNNKIQVETYTNIIAKYRPSNNQEYDVAVDFTIKGFGKINENLKLYICEISYSSDSSMGGDWNEYLSSVWEYKTEKSEWKSFTDINFILEDSPQHGMTYSIYLRKNSYISNIEHNNGILKFSGALKEVVDPQIKVSAEKIFTNIQELKVTYNISNLNEVLSSWNLILTNIEYTSTSGDDWTIYLNEIWQYRIEGSEIWQNFVIGETLFEDLKTCDYTIYVRKNPDINEETEPYSGGTLKFTATLQEVTE